MFNHIIVRQFRPLDTAAPLDLGMLAESLLYYGTVEIPINDAILRQLAMAIEVDQISDFIDRGWFRLTHSSDFAAIRTDNSGSPIERHAPVIAQIQRPSGAPIDLFDIVPRVLIEVTGKEGKGRRAARRLIPKIQVSATNSDLLPHVESDLQDESYTDLAAISVLKTFAPEYRLPPEPYFRCVREGEFYIARTNLALPQKAVTENSSSQATLTPSYILSHIVNTRLALDEAAMRDAEITSDSVYSTLATHRLRTAVSRRDRSDAAISAFQDFVFEDSRAIREAVNSGERTLKDLVPVLEAAERFKSWLKEKPLETDLVREYFREVTRDTWIDRLPGRTTRFVFFTGAGLALDVWLGGIGTAIGLGLSTADAFLLDRIIKGWKPSQFVETVQAFLQDAGN